MDFSDFSPEAFDQVLIGTGGNDTIDGFDGGNQLIDGGAGNDWIYGRDGNDVLFGGDGNDRINGGRGNDLLVGGAGNDLLYSGRNGSTLEGGSGDDLLQASLLVGATHVLTGGTGADGFEVIDTDLPAIGHVIITDFELEIDTLVLSPDPPATVSSGAGDLVLTLAGGDTVTLEGVSTHDWLALNGTDFGGITQGGAGNDRYIGGAGDEIFAGGEGNDLIVGGAGNDIILGGEGDDILSAGQGRDTLDGGAGNDTLHGNAGNNLLLGGAGDDYITSGNQTSRLEGGEGADHLLARMISGGSHVMIGGTGADHFEFACFDVRKRGSVVITDLELGLDRVTIDGMDLGAYQLATGAALTDTPAGALLQLVSNDTILFEGLAADDIGAWYFGALVT